MHLTIKRHNGDVLNVYGSFKTEERLKNTCFRDQNRRRAGIIFRWRFLRDVLSDQTVLNCFLEDVENALAEKTTQNSVTITCPFFIGWSSTDRVDLYHVSDLERFNPNKRSTALRIKLSRMNLPAPLTDRMTIVYELRFVQDSSTVVVHSLYPGQDIGTLEGDLTAREGIVFFDWNHPGMSI